ncbi:sigma-70 family RNA polymerase sigma factor [Sphingobium sp. CCH11-B1]|uniref:sigma-70 family RNA polymerase sigma factor n=1 Tax=Sphingobium sp. CCH11-B1 TaxID=1768781 RepID=UPI00083482AD|nr:sigma-70 family RNA polymerase sigma factor [Sphingobium sp. CCH11-B1]
MMADEQTLSRLMAAAQAGDRQAYAVLLAEARRWLLRYLARKVPPAHLDDLVQEVLVSLHAKRARYDPGRPFLPWLAAIARYRWVDHLRRSYRRAEVELGESDAAHEGDADAVMARTSLDRLFDSLPRAQARAIELVKIEGHSISEAAARCGQSEPSVKVNIHRGLKRLAALIEKAD